MQLERHFISREKDLPTQAAGYLARDWAEGNIDLASDLIVVSSRQAGRRLREALAVRAASRDGAVFPPLVVTPEFLLTHALDKHRIAGAADSLLAWTNVLQEVELDSCAALFPSAPQRRDFPWALRTAREFMRVKKLLGEGGLRMEDVAARMPGEFGESERWREIGRLERLYRGELAGWGLQDAEEAKIGFAGDPKLPDQVERVVLLAVPDLLPAALSVLEHVASAIPIEVVIYCEEERGDYFDQWGRPLPEKWEASELEAGPDDGQLHLGGGPEDQASRTASLLAVCRDPAASAAIAAPDAEVIPFLERMLPQQCGVNGYNPEGFSVKSEELYVVLGAFRDLMRYPGFSVSGDLLRCPLFFRYLESLSGLPGAPEMFRCWDAFHQRHLPGDIDDAFRLARNDEAGASVVRRIIEVIGELLKELSGGPLWEVLPAVMQRLHGGRHFDEDDASDRRYATVAGELMALLSELRGSAAAESLPRGADGLELVLALLGEKRIEEERPERAVDLQGWLELLWENAPCLILTGINEHSVPESITGDPFVPESLRQALGLKNNRARLARDLYIFESLFRSRRDRGRVDVVCGKTSEAGDPLRPSRLLLRCPKDTLPDRVARLFADAPVSGIRAPWTSPWRLAPRTAAHPETISVTQFARYLQCPFRYYLTEVLEMEPMDPRKAEMDDAEFGNICHRVLEEFGNDHRLKHSEDPAEIGDFFEDRLNRLFTGRYGRHLSAPLMIQKEAAAQRLARLARVQAEERANGWLIEEVEWTFREQPGLSIGGMPLRGKIDRIERNEHTGLYRIIDYKTSDKSKPPETDHFSALKKTEDIGDFPEYAVFSKEGKDFRWTGLQLPLYRRAVRDRCGDEVQCGYFNLPKAVSETGVRLWEDSSPDLIDSAIRCAEGVVADLRRGRFWPPAESVEYDAFEELFFGDPVGMASPERLPGGSAGDEGRAE